jgi:hypothetical protein
MKKCTYCGCENADEATVCKECREKLACTKENVDQLKVDLNALAPGWRSRIRFISAAFSLAILPVLPFIVFIPFRPFLILAFPSGLWALLRDGDSNPTDALRGWIIYSIAISVLMLQRRRIWFFLFYIVLCVMLAANVVGCYKVVSTTLHGIQ